MKPEKMTDERLRELLYNIRHTWSAKASEEIGDHIAALTAERDEARSDAEAQASLVESWSDALGLEQTDGYDKAEAVREERDALRERVRALETDAEAAQATLEDEQAAHAETLERMRVAESRLAAIRQRAGDIQAMDDALSGGGIVGVSRYVLGEDATGAETKQEHAHSYMAGRNASCPAPEPTTAEAFATVRKWIDVYAASGLRVDGVLPTISLLERRMGAMAVYLKRNEPCRCGHSVTRHTGVISETETTGCVATADGGVCQCMAFESALTDAPPVFTLEDVRSAGEDVAEDCEPGPVALTDDAAEAYASGWARGARTIADRIAALRKVTP